MKNIYSIIIKFLFNNYCGTYQATIFGKKYSAVKASRILFPFMILWGITKLFQVELHISTLDVIFILLFLVQYLAGFTNVVRNEYKRLFPIEYKKIEDEIYKNI